MRYEPVFDFVSMVLWAFVFLFVFLGVAIAIGIKVNETSEREQEIVLSILRRAQREMTGREIEKEAHGIKAVYVVLSRLLDQKKILSREETTPPEVGSLTKLYYRAHGVSPGA